MMFVGALSLKRKSLFWAALGCFSLFSNNAYSQCCGCQTAATQATTRLQQFIEQRHETSGDLGTTRPHITDQHTQTKDHITQQHEDTREWIRETWWINNVAPALQDMTEEITTMGMAGAMSIGGFFDAQNHIQAQTELSELRAEAYKDYIPSTSLCVFGTGIKSLAATQQDVITTKNVLVEWSLDRQLGNGNVEGAEGAAKDKLSRVEKFKRTYCDPADSSGAFMDFCEFDDTENPVDPDRVNMDIDYTRAFDSKLTLDLDFGDGVPSNDEQDIMALATNLYAHNLFFRPDMDVLAVEANQDEYMDTRSIIAKRNVAENSFFSIAAMKSKGSMSNMDYIQNALLQMGVDNTALTKYLGANPSYHAQMEVLTKKLYQSPNFYVNLVDSPTNIDRQHAAMQSFELMQQRDIFESFLRTEMLLSILVELELEDLQQEIQNDIGDMETSGERE